MLGLSVVGVSGTTAASRPGALAVGDVPMQVGGGGDEPVSFSAADIAADGESNYIVRFQPGTDVHVAVGRLASAGADVDAVYEEVFPGAAVQLTDAEADIVRQDPAVATVEADNAIVIDEPASSDLTALAVEAPASWGLDRLDQRFLPLSGSYSYGSDGSGVDVYVIDSGILVNHADFGGRVSGGAYLLDGEGPNDCNGHGTHVAGIVGSNTYGVAKRVHLVPIRYLNCAGSGTDSGLIGALQWMINDHPFGRPAVANLSLGGSANSAVDSAVQAAINDGITVVVAAGNDGTPACYNSPARVAAAITVAATDTTDYSPNWSNWGACVDVFAPGTNIVSLSNLSTTGTAIKSGTSMASPFAAGVAALLLQQTPSATPGQISAQLTAQATPNLVSNPGTGSPNALLYSPPPPAPVPSPAPPPSPVPPPQTTPPPTSSEFTAMTPARLLDSRGGSATVDGQYAGIGLRGAGWVTELQVAGRAGIPANATTASLNVTVTDAQQPGFVTVYPCGQPVPTASNLNYAAGDTIPNAVITQIGIGGKVCLFTYGATQLVTDINGYFPAGTSFTAMTPARLLDSRGGSATVDGQYAGIGLRGAGWVTELQVAGRAGIPANATTASLNVTVTDAQQPGFVTVYPCGQPVPTASNLNYAAGDTIPNAVITQIGIGGKVCLFTYGATQLVTDINGYFPAGTSFTAMTPARLLDSRGGSATVDGQYAGIGLRGAGWVTELQVAGRAGIPANATTASLNVTVTDAQQPGFVTVYPCGQPVPTASNLNYAAGDTIPNAVITQIGIGGKVCLFTYGATQLVTDINGYFPAI